MLFCYIESIILMAFFSFPSVFPVSWLPALVITASKSGKKNLQVFSLWAVSDRSYGGLSFTSTDVGNVLAASGK